MWTSSFLTVLAGCNVTPNVDPVVSAQTYIGLKERQNRNELEAFVGVDPVRTEWWAAFVNAVWEIENIPGSESVSDVPLMARSFLTWGEAVDPELIQRGDIVVFPRGNSGWQGHVGFFVEEQNGLWVILGGNQRNEVRYDLFKPNKAIGIRRYVIQTEARGSLPLLLQ